MSKFIYKYLPFNMNTLNILINGNLYLASPDTLNDPFEGEFILEGVNTIPSNKFLKKEGLPESIKLEELQEIVKVKFKKYVHNQYGVSCFSKNKNNLLMWSHYADSHKGLCIIFDKEKLINSLKLNYTEVSIDEIKYSNSFPKIKANLSELGSNFIRTENVFLRKLNQWKYENEVRIHYKIPENFTQRNLCFDYSSIFGVIEGEKFSEENKSLLTNIIRNQSNLNHLKWFKAKSNLVYRKMEIEQFGGYFIPRKITITKGDDSN